MVIASNREASFAAWRDAWASGGSFPWDVTILVHDGDLPPTGDDDGLGIVRHGWDEIAAASPGGKFPEWLSRRDSGIKAWGFLRAVLDHDADVVMTLDDDVVVAPGTNPGAYVRGHLDALYRTPRWTTTVPGFTPRGLPYGLPGGPDGASSLGGLPVALNMGLWREVPDRDAPHALTEGIHDGRDGHSWEPPAACLATRVIAPDQYAPLCGMSLAFRRELAPLMYFPRMGQGVPFARFDDIWSGVLAQRAMRHLGLAWTVGGPLATHAKASNPMTNLVKEAPGIRANEEFWRVVDAVDLAGCGTPLACMRAMAAHFRAGTTPVADPLLGPYLRDLGGWMDGWCDGFADAGWA
jgi:hypothetical protein